MNQKNKKAKGKKEALVTAIKAQIIIKKPTSNSLAAEPETVAARCN